MDSKMAKLITERLSKPDLILVVRVPVLGMSQEKIWLMAKDSSEVIKKAVPEARVIVLPVNQTDGSIECINPRLVNLDEWQKIEDTLNRLEADIASFRPVGNQEVK